MDRYVFSGSARDVNGLSAEHLKPEWAQNQLRVSTFNFKLATAFHRAASDAPTDSGSDPIRFPFFQKGAEPFLAFIAGTQPGDKGGGVIQHGVVDGPIIDAGNQGAGFHLC